MPQSRKQGLGRHDGRRDGGTTGDRLEMKIPGLVEGYVHAA
jgi:hypothetical protein